MESANAFEIPRSPAETSGRQRIALVVNDLQVGAAIGVACALLCLAGCGGDRPAVVPPPVVTHILSNPHFDGDIEQTRTSYIVTQGMSPSVQSVLAGHDPTTRNEFRAFLNFPLGGSGGVPLHAFIDSAFLELLVDNVIPVNGRIPVRVELVAFQPPTLIGTEFDLPPLGAVLVNGNVTAADIGWFVPVDVTSLMIQAQQRGLVDFQVRIMQDLGPAIFTLMVIDNPITADRPQRAPLLTVAYH